jgi:hypothetical protein
MNEDDYGKSCWVTVKAIILPLFLAIRNAAH